MRGRVVYPAMKRGFSVVGLRGVLALGALGLALASWLTYRAEAAERRDLERELAEVTAGPPSPELLRELASEPEPERARLLLARRLVTGAFAPPGPGAGAPDVAGTVERLGLARRLSAHVLAHRPAAWQAAMLLGTSTYLSRSLARDPALFTDVPGWDDPLELARDLAPGKEEPARFQVSAYLELWSVLSPAKREQTLALLEDAFRDPRTFARLAPAWLLVAEDREAAFAPVPEDATAWRELERLYNLARDWDGVADARRRGRAALEASLRRDLEEARRLLEGGEAGAARSIYHRVLTEVRRDTAFAPLVREGLHFSPPGPAGADAARRYAVWLEFALDLCLVGDCPLPPPYLDRLTTLARPLSPALEARGRLAAEDLVEAERLERQVRFTATPEWTRFHLERARALFARGDREGAREALDRVTTADRAGPLYRRVAAEVGGGRGGGTGEPGGLQADPWTADTGDDGGLRRFVDLAEPARALALEHEDVADEGAVVEVAVDGRILPPRRVRPGRDLVLDVPLDAGLHLVRWRSVAGVPPRPGRLTPRRQAD